MHRPTQTTRRQFIQNGLVTGLALTAVPRFARSQTTTQSAESAYKKLRIAYIGTGGIGGHHLEETVKLGVSCPCYCDVDTNAFAGAAKNFPNAKPYQDYREMFDKQAKDIDAVMIGTPDHQHYPATMLAMKLGKHVYTQKPLTHTPWEARQLAAAARKYKVATQMGNQGHALEGWRLIYEWIHGGAIGDVKEVHSWTDRPIWPQGMDRPEGAGAVPSNLNWDVWLGPAAERPFKKDTYHPFKWRGWLDFGAGALGDMACHTMDGIFFALDPGHPTSIEPLATTPVNNETFPKASIVKWEFPAREIALAGSANASKTTKRPAFTAYWYDGGLKPPRPPEIPADVAFADCGNLFVGEKACILVGSAYGESPRVFSKEKARESGNSPQLLERSPGHVKEWVMACVGEKPADFPKSNFAYACPMTETILLGNIALRAGRRLNWDGPGMKFTNCPDANKYLTKEYRSGWDFS